MSGTQVCPILRLVLSPSALYCHSFPPTWPTALIGWLPASQARHWPKPSKGRALSATRTCEEGSCGQRKEGGREKQPPSGLNHKDLRAKPAGCRQPRCTWMCPREKQGPRSGNHTPLLPPCICARMVNEPRTGADPPLLGSGEGALLTVDSRALLAPSLPLRLSSLSGWGPFA